VEQLNFDLAGNGISHLIEHVIKFKYCRVELLLSFNWISA